MGAVVIANGEEEARKCASSFCMIDAWDDPETSICEEIDASSFDEASLVLNLISFGNHQS